MEDKRLQLARALLGKNEVRKQGDNMRLDPLYQQHVIDSQVSGTPTLPRDQWMQQYMAQQK